MAQFQAHLPDDLYELAKAHDLPLSELLQKAVRAELRRLELLEEADRVKGRQPAPPPFPANR